MNYITVRGLKRAKGGFCGCQPKIGKFKQAVCIGVLVRMELGNMYRVYVRQVQRAGRWSCLI